VTRRPATSPPHHLRLAAVLGFTGASLVVAACGSSPDAAGPSTTSTVASPNVYDAACAGTLVASVPGQVASPDIDEPSGIVASRRNPGVWWVHNDSCDTARVFAIADDGRHLGAFTLAGATATDWEDVAVGPGPVAGTSYLYVADTGDNPFDPTRPSVSVYRVPEPVVDSGVAAPPPQVVPGAARLSFTYPDGPHDAETLLVDPRTGELYVVTKSLSGPAQVFHAPPNLPASSTTALTQVATIPVLLATGGDVSPSGELVALRTDALLGNGTVLVYRRDGASLADAFGGSPCSGAAGDEPQGEAIGFTPDGRAYVTVSEGMHSPLHRFSAP
jgi:hypothetical protein